MKDCEKHVPLITKILFHNTWRKKTDGKPASPGSPGK